MGLFFNDITTYLIVFTDPYVKVEMYVNGIRTDKHKTKVRQNTQDPVWNHPCVFEINRENPKLLGHAFVFQLIHKDMMMGVQKLGQVSMNIYMYLRLYLSTKETFEYIQGFLKR